MFKCTSFSIRVVAFITVGGLTPLLETFKNLEEKGIHGQILTTDYLMFSDPRALEKLEQFSNIELKMYCCQENEEGFHTKGCALLKMMKVSYHILMGSSNLTLNALNKEYKNGILIFTVREEEKYTHHLFQEFKQLWTSRNTKDYASIQSLYKERFAKAKPLKTKLTTLSKEESVIIQPNPNLMQKEVIKKS